MALAKTQQPPNVVLSENPVLFGFETDNLYATTGAKAEFSLFMSALPTLGDEFTLTINSTNYLFTFVANPGNDPGDLPATWSGVGFGTFSAYLTQVKDELLKHPYLSKYYTISIEGGTNGYILFIAKDTGAKYTIALTVAGGSVVSTDPVYNVTGVDQTVNPFFGVYLQCIIENELAGEDLLTPNAEGLVQYDVSAYLKAAAEPSFLWPVTGYAIKRTGLLKRFWVQYAERYGIPQQIYKLKSTYGFISHALPGGASWLQNAAYEAQQSSWWQKLPINKQFLTSQPPQKEVKLDQTEKLFFLNYQSSSPLKLKADLMFYETLGTETTVVLASVPSVKYDVIEISFSLNDILEPLTDPGRLYRATLYLVNQLGEVVSEKRWYLADYRAELHSHAFIWRNSYGMYDTDLFTGRYQKSVASEKQVFNLTNNYSFSPTEAPVRVMRSTEVERIGASSGWIEDTNRANWLRELLISREVYEVIDGSLVPVVITSADVDITTDGKTLHNVQFEYTRAFTDEHFSKVGAYVSAIFQQSFNQAQNNSTI